MKYMRVAIYARYSSDNQREESIDAQVRACREYAQRHNHTVVNVYADDAISGKASATKKHAQYQKMLRDAQSNRSFDLLLVHKYDRVARSVTEHFNLAAKPINAGIDIIAAACDFGTSKEAKLMRVIMWALSEYYIENLADEVKKGHKENAYKALHNGGCGPF